MLTFSKICAATTLAMSLCGTAVLAEDPPKLSPLALSKECSDYTGETPSYCTITASSLAEIPVGTKVFYYGPAINSPLFTSSAVVLALGPGESAIGHCIVHDRDTPPSGHCAFTAGSGALAGFQAIVNVTVDDQQIWHWNGGYFLPGAK